MYIHGEDCEKSKNIVEKERSVMEAIKSIISGAQNQFSTEVDKCELVFENAYERLKQFVK